MCEPEVGVAANEIALPPNGESSIQVFNRDTCGPVEFVVAVGASWLTVVPGEGSIPAFGEITLQISAVPPPEGETEASVTISGPANTVTVLVEYSP